MRGITKHSMTGPRETVNFFYFPRPLNVPTLRVSGKQNSLFPLGPVIKCLLFSGPVKNSIQVKHGGSTSESDLVVFDQNRYPRATKHHDILRITITSIFGTYQTISYIRDGTLLKLSSHGNKYIRSSTFHEFIKFDKAWVEDS